MTHEQALQKAREWYATNSFACAKDALSGAVRVNDLAAYMDWCKVMHDKALAGAYDHTVAVRQRAHYIRTGECVVILTNGH